MSPWLGIGVVLAALGALMAGVRFGQKAGKFSAEGSRKAVHVGMGMLCLSFPWIFAETWPVWLLAGMAVVALCAVRWLPVLRREVGGVLHDVKRASWGEVYFPLSVALVFTLAEEEVVRFVVPVALLTFADAAGALVGKRWGRRKFATIEGEKSLEGSLAVGAAGVLVSVGPLIASGMGWGQALLMAVALGLFALLVEAISWRGLDNVFLPVAALVHLDHQLDATWGVLWARTLVLAGLAGLALVWRRGHVVDDCARLGGALMLYFFWVAGGWTWLVAPVILLASYVRLMPTVPGGAPKHDLVAVICVGSAGFFWAVAKILFSATGSGIEWLWGFTAGIATQQAIIAMVRFSQGRSAWPRWSWWVIAVAQAAGFQWIAFAVLVSPSVSLVAWGCGVLAVAAGAGIFALVERELSDCEDLNLRWWKQGISALVASASGWIILTT